jgi:hypothetical protein
MAIQEGGMTEYEAALENEQKRFVAREYARKARNEWIAEQQNPAWWSFFLSMKTIAAEPNANTIYLVAYNHKCDELGLLPAERTDDGVHRVQMRGMAYWAANDTGEKVADA